MSCSDQSLIQSAIIICGGLFAFIQWGKSLRISRSKFVQAKLGALLQDDVQEILTCQDSCEDAWLDSRIGMDDTEKKAENANFETRLRRTLCILDELSHLYFIGNIAETDLNLFLPILLRVASDGQVRKYVSDQRNDYKERVKKNACPYMYFILLGKLYGIEDSAFSDYKFGFIGLKVLQLRRFLSRFFSLSTFCGVEKIVSTVNNNEHKIGTIVVGKFKQCIVARAEKDEDVIRDLTDCQYSKKHFGLSYPVLMLTEEVGEKLNRRYYVEGFKIKDKSYRLCNNWFERQRNAIMLWMNQR